MPINVYLDSSDYSRFAERRELGVLDALRNYIVRGHVVVRYSGAHVLEAAPRRMEHMAYASARLAVIQELSQNHCMIWHDDLIESEAEKAVNGAAINSMRDDGVWFPKEALEVAFPSPMELARESLRDLNREQRREAERDNFRGSAFSVAGLRRFQSTAGPLLETLRRDFPISGEAETIVNRYFSGQASGDEMMVAVLRSMTNLNVFARWYVTHWDEVSRLATWFTETGRRYEAKFNEMKEQIDGVWVTGRAGGIEDAQIRYLQRSALRSAAIRIAAGWAASISGMTIGDDHASKFASEARGLTVATTLLGEVAIAGTGAPEGRRTTRPSDAGDVLHSLYLPYVDLFRADAFMASLITSFLGPYSAKVVSSIGDLPSRIDALMAQQIRRTN